MISYDHGHYWQPWRALGEFHETAEMALRDIKASAAETGVGHYMDAVVIIGRP